MKKFIAIAGNMGVGKTTLTKKLSEHFGWKACFEPVEENPYLKDFYQNMKKWAFHSQMFFLGKRLKDHCRLINEKRSVISDRSLYENAEVFAKNLYLNKYISERDWQVYQQVYQTSVKILPAPDLIIYLKASVEKIMSRIKKRGRDFEKKVSSDYVKSLNDLYDEWLINAKFSQVITINYDHVDLKYNEVDFKNFLENIKSYLK
jgi:hypothetical protein